MRLRMHLAILGLLGSLGTGCQSAHQSAPVAHTDSAPSPSRSFVPSGVPREYWIAVEPIQWNLIPNTPPKSDDPDDPPENAVVTALHYTTYSPNFAQPLARFTRSNGTLELAGPVIEAEVGDQVILHFKNMDSYYKVPHSIHVHGLEYSTEMDGAYSGAEPDKPGTAVAYGDTFTYTYQAQISSLGIWPYHDHSVDNFKNVALGMYGAIRVREPNEVRPDQEFYLFLVGMDAKYTGLKRDYDTINGGAYINNTPNLEAKLGQTVRFNVIAFGNDFHTFHLHGYRWIQDGQPEDIHVLGPASAWSFTITADNPGNWMYHCHVDDHMANGMMGMFMVH